MHAGPTFLFALSRGSFGDTDIGPVATDLMFSGSTFKMFHRECNGCLATHKSIYYKRTSPVPYGFSIYDHIATNWFSANNLLHTDFELYSTLADALAGNNKWKYCNYDDSLIGFPRNCRPPGSPSAEGQWNSFSSAHAPGQYNVRFSVSS